MNILVNFTRIILFTTWIIILVKLTSTYVQLDLPVFWCIQSEFLVGAISIRKFLSVKY